MRQAGAETQVARELDAAGGRAEPTAARAAADDVLEMALPWPEVGPGPVALAVSLWQSGAELERHPDGGRIEVHELPAGEERDRA